jgi:hypothetical protein
MKTNFLCLVAFAVSLAGASAGPLGTDDATFTIESWVTGGGGSCRGDGFELTGTAGQPATGGMSGDGYDLAVGFWNQEPLAPSTLPRLVLQLGPGGSLIVMWPFPSPGFRLQWTDALSSTPGATAWNDWAGPAPIADGVVWKVSYAAGTGSQFLRLIAP